MSGYHLVPSSIEIRDHKGKIVKLTTFRSATAAIEERKDAIRRRDVATISGSASDTVDMCFEGANIDPTICGIQGGSMTINWTLTPQPPNGTIASYSDTGLPSGVADSDTFQPSAQAAGPYTTTQTILIDQNAPISSSDMVSIAVACNNGISCSGQAMGVGVLCSVTYFHCPELQIADNNLGYVVAAPSPLGTPLTVIGAPQSLSAAIAPNTGSGSYSLSDFDWTIAGEATAPPTVVKGYSFADSSASVGYLQASDLANQNLSFYWLSGSGPLGLVNNAPSTTVDGIQPSLGTSAIANSAFATRSDKNEIATLTANATYDVDAPDVATIIGTPSLKGTQYGRYALNTSTLPPSFTDALSLGSALVYPANAGMLITLTGSMPTSSSGSVAETQLVHFSRTVTAMPGETASPSNASSGQSSYADGCALYVTNLDGSAGTSRSLSISAGAPIAFGTVDSPAEFPNATDDASMQVEQDYQSYFMFKPTAPNSIWVAIGEVKWSWSGTAAVQSNGSYSLTQSTSPTGPLLGFSTYLLPTWSQVRPSTTACHSVSG